MTPYILDIPDDVERQLRRCRVPLRESIRRRLDEIVKGAGAKKRAAGGGRPALSKGPPLRFYVFEGYRVSYQVNPVTRRVVVIKVRSESSESS